MYLSVSRFEVLICLSLGSPGENCDFENDLCKALQEENLQLGWIRRNGQSSVGPPYSDHSGNDTGKNSHVL